VKKPQDPAACASSDAPADSVSEQRYRSVVDNSPYGIYRVTYDGRFVTLNPALCQMLGYTPDELRTLNIQRVYADPSERQRVVAEYDNWPHGKAYDLNWRRKDGRAIVARVWVYAARDAEGEIEYFDGYVEDVTAIRTTEQALRQSEKLAALGQLVSGVAHELNNPLSAILLFAEDLLTSERSAEEQEALGLIAQQARRSRAIVRDLLSFVRSREAVREPVETGPFLDQLARALMPQLAELEVWLHVDACESTVSIDRAGIEQVLTNLIVNAGHATGPGGEIWLSARVSNGQFIVDVADNGPGIRADVLPRIFEPFFTTKPMGLGTGLGLSVSLGVVQQHGGAIVARNRDMGEGGGAQFTMRIPMFPSGEFRAAPEPVQALAAEGQPQARRVLLVEDEETIRRALSRFYRRRGWTVVEAEDGARAFERLLDAGETFDLVLSDVKMPHVSGIELHGALKDLRPELLPRLVFCTGEVESPQVAAFVAETSCRVLVKPFDLKTLASLSDEIASRAAPAASPIS